MPSTSTAFDLRFRFEKCTHSVDAFSVFPYLAAPDELKRSTDPTSHPQPLLSRTLSCIQNLYTC